MFLDTEGCIAIRKHLRDGKYQEYQIRVDFANTCRPLVERAREIVGIGSIQRELNRHRKRPVFHLVLAGRAAGRVLGPIARYLVVKPKRAQIALAVQRLAETNGHGRTRSTAHILALDRAWLAIKALNKRGEWVEGE